MASPNQRIRLFHWRESESGPLIALLEKAGYEVDYQGEHGVKFASLRQHPTHAVVIDLTRMPSHGRYVAAEIRSRKSLCHLPIVFVDGDPVKLQKIRETVPDAVFVARSKLIVALKKVKPLTSPSPTKPMMASYVERTVAQKLGITEKMRVAVIDPPRDYGKAIGKLPQGAQLEEEPEETLPLTLWFVRDPETYLDRLAGMRRLCAKSRLWVIYPKCARGRKAGLTQFVVRDAALELGLVDYKICSVDATWTGMLFAVKKT